MPLSVGERLGPYEISASIGKGGMGEVYQARDTRLNREVAIKVSSERFGERFEREARAIAALNHPNICTLYDIGPNYLVMELVEGLTLAERIASGPIPLEEALNIARQIADALEAAHEKGITHRDLKPANVKIAAGGTVKVLDFGLAKVGQTPSHPESAAVESPTLSMTATQAGVILGTAAYMSPEQASGKPVDKRADIWAFGVVLCEMLTGKRVFTGETISHTLAAVLVKEADLSHLPADTPASIHRLLRRCLERDLKRRLLDIASARLEIEAATERGPEPQRALPIPQPPRLRWLWPSVAAVFLLGLAAISFLHFREKPPVAALVRFQVPSPSKTAFDVYLVLSPDGRRLAFTATGEDGGSRIWIRDMDTLEARPLNGTEGAGSVIWSPDSRFIAFGLGQQLKKIDVAGGPPQTLCTSASAVGSGAWSAAGVIIFGGRGAGGLQQVSAAGGTPSPVTAIDRGGFHTFPSFLPDGRHFIYFRNVGGQENIGIYVGSLDSKPDEQSAKRLVATGFGAVFAPDPDGGMGRVLFVRDSTLMAQSFDPARLELAGEAVPVAERVGSTNQYASVTASGNGLLAYRTGGAGNIQLTWVDLDGKRLDQVGEPGQYAGLGVSSDGMHAAVRRSGDLWLLDLTRGISTRFTFGQGVSDTALWSPDGSQVIFRSNRNGKYDLYRKASNGAGEDELLLQSDQDKTPTSWSRDGRFLMYTSVDPKTGFDLWVLPLEGDRKPIPFLRTEFNDVAGAFSPDGRWVAYVSTESGNLEVYVRPFATSGQGAAAGKWQVSKGGALTSRPFWRADGKQLYYRASSGAVMAVDVTTSPTFQVGESHRLFNLLVNLAIDAPADGKRFLVGMPQQDAGPQAITVVQNWQRSLKQ